MKNTIASIQTLKTQLKSNTIFYLIILLATSFVISTLNAFLTEYDLPVSKVAIIAMQCIGVIIQLALVVAVILAFIGAHKDKDVLIKAAVIILQAYFIILTVEFAAYAVFIALMRNIIVYAVGYIVLALAVTYTSLFIKMLFAISRAFKTQNNEFNIPSYISVINTIIATLMIISGVLCCIGGIFQAISDGNLDMFASFISCLVMGLTLINLSEFLSNCIKKRNSPAVMPVPQAPPAANANIAETANATATETISEPVAETTTEVAESLAETVAEPAAVAAPVPVTKPVKTKKEKNPLVKKIAYSIFGAVMIIASIVIGVI